VHADFAELRSRSCLSRPWHGGAAERLACEAEPRTAFDGFNFGLAEISSHAKRSGFHHPVGLGAGAFRNEVHDTISGRAGGPKSPRLEEKTRLLRGHGF
jgi:hypothetical protein